jgi:threonine dehydratase
MSDSHTGPTRISLDRIIEASDVIAPVFRNTPQFVPESLSARIGVQVLCKVECVNPIRSFKGRGADYFLYRNSNQDTTPLVAASAGNFGQGLAYAARARKRPVILFAATNANPLKVERMRAFGADVRLAGNDFDAAKAVARDFAGSHGFCFVEDGRESAIAEGAGTIAVEICRWPERPEVIFVPVGNGALINGVGRWLKAHAPECRVIGVCAAGAPAMAESFRTGSVRSTSSVDTIADGIAVRIPVPEALAEMADCVDEVILVGEERLLEAMRLIYDEMGLVTEPAGVAGLAAILDVRASLAGQFVATPICGGNLTPEQIGRWLAGEFQ